MSKQFWVQFHFADFLQDTITLSCQATGGWVRVLLRMWHMETGTLSGSYSFWGRIMVCSPKEAEAIIVELSQENVCNLSRKSNDSNGDVTLISRRLLRQYNEKENNRLRKQKQRHHGDVTVMSQKSHSPLVKVKVKVKKRKKPPPTPQGDCVDFFLPEFINPETWKDLLDMRKAKGKKFEATQKAQELIIKKLTKLHEQGQDPNAVLEQSIISSWQNVFELKQEKKKQPQSPVDGCTEFVQVERPSPIIKSQSPQAEKIWEVAKAKIESKIDQEAFDTWFAPTAGFRLDGTLLVVGVPSKLFANWLHDHYGNLIENILNCNEFKFEVVP